MMIDFSCPNCSRPFSVNESLAGRTAKCPECQSNITVPAPKSLPLPPPSVDSPPEPSFPQEYSKPVEVPSFVPVATYPSASVDDIPEDRYAKKSQKQYKLDYKRNGFYFDPVPVKSIAPGVIVTLIGIPLLFIVIGIVVMLIGIVMIISALNYNKNRVIVTDSEIDRVCEAHLNNLKSMALKRLGIDEDQVLEAEPIQVDGYYYNKLPSSSLHYKLGNDGVLRSSNYNAAMFFFSEDQIYCYCFRFSLLKDVKQEITEECFYSDIVSVSTNFRAVTNEETVIDMANKLLPASKSFLPFPIRIFVAITDGVRKLLGGFGTDLIKEKKTEYFASFELITSGSTEMKATFSNMETVEHSINGMRNLVRSKKQQQQDNKYKYTKISA